MSTPRFSRGRVTVVVFSKYLVSLCTKAHRLVQHGLSRIMTTKTTAGIMLYAGTGTVPREVVPAGIGVTYR